MKHSADPGVAGEEVGGVLWVLKHTHLNPSGTFVYWHFMVISKFVESGCWVAESVWCQSFLSIKNKK